MNLSQFEFHEWQSAFAEFYKRRPADPTLVFLVCTAAYVSGYWIMSTASKEFKNVHAGDFACLYSTIHDVKLFERRLRRKLNPTKSLSLGEVVI